MKNKLSRAILACVYNGERLISDSEELIYDHYSTAMYLAIIAQEEIAKAFIFYLILKGTMDWDDAKTIIKDHKSKQILAFIIDYLEPDFDEWNRRYSLEDIGKPIEIKHALNTLVLEKIKGYEKHYSNRERQCVRSYWVRICIYRCCFKAHVEQNKYRGIFKAGVISTSKVALNEVI